MEETFGPYRIEALIGRGGMGEVHRAIDTVRDRAVALKRLPVALAQDAEYRARFRKEAALAARLHEPHIIPIHDFGEIDGVLYIDMRLVAGDDLGALLHRHGAFAPRRAVNVVAQVAAALDVAHGMGLVHRDIKPGNMLVTPASAGDTGAGEFVYVVDFGIARSLDGGSTSLTATGAAVGSVDYMAPERFAGHGDHRVDVYSLGCVLFEALTARKPYVVSGLPAMMNAHVNRPPPRPSEIVPDLPAAFDTVVARAMAKDPEERFASCGELAGAARAAAEDPAAQITTRAPATTKPETVASAASGRPQVDRRTDRLPLPEPGAGPDQRPRTLVYHGPGGPPPPRQAPPAERNQGPASPPPELSAPAAPPKRRRRGAVLAAVGVAVVAALLGAAVLFGLLGGSRSPAPTAGDPTTAAPAAPAGVALYTLPSTSDATTGTSGGRADPAQTKVPGTKNTSFRVGCDGETANTAFQLGGAYRSVSGKIVFVPDAPAALIMDIRLLGDGKVLDSVTLGTDETYAFEVATTGVRSFTLSVRSTSGRCTADTPYGYGVLADTLAVR